MIKRDAPEGGCDRENPHSGAGEELVSFLIPRSLLWALGHADSTESQGDTDVCLWGIEPCGEQGLASSPKHLQGLVTHPW